MNQWEATDRVTRADFNADNAAIDAALKSVADAAGSGAKIVASYYVGDGADEQFIDLGFTPRAVVTWQSGFRQFNNSILGGIALVNRPCSNCIVVEQNGFRVFHGSGQYTNQNGAQYVYLAIA